MDRNSIIGLVLIGLLFIGYQIYTQPSAEQIAVMKHQRDSVATANAREIRQADSLALLASSKTISTPGDSDNLNDSAKAELMKQQLGVFASSGAGTEQINTLENDLFKISFTNKGGKVRSVQLKKYKTSGGSPVLLMSDTASSFGFSISAQNRVINTNDLYFTSKQAGNTIAMQLNVAAGKYFEYVYSLGEEPYSLNYKVNIVGLNDVIAQNANYLSLDWKQNITPQETNIQNERIATTIYYRFPEEDVDFLSETSDKQESLKTKIKWVAFKQQYFTCVLIADNAFETPVVETSTDKTSEKIVKRLTASMDVPYEHKASESIGMKFYLGPNHYTTLKHYDLGLEKQIPLGWGIFGWVNRFLVIPVFNWLNSFNLNFGIIILILTIVVRIVILPLTYRSFISQAKMKVLQPEIKEINDRYPDDPVKKQQATMEFYRKAGVNPLGGCIPGLLQMPILIAMFRFFPSSIELRQQSFLWAKDLSTFDSIYDFPNHFSIPGYGDHISLFTLLMTLSTLLYTRMNMQMTSAANPQMKWMMYLMPVIFLGVFNRYSAGLSYYYFLSNMFGFLQQFLFKRMINEDEIHRKLQENKKKPVKKSGFQARLEEMAKQRGYKPAKR